MRNNSCRVFHFVLLKSAFMVILRELTTNIIKLDRFDGENFVRWQKRIHFLLVSLQVVYVLNIPRPKESENKTLAETRKRQKWETDNEIYRGHSKYDE